VAETTLPFGPQLSTKALDLIRAQLLRQGRQKGDLVQTNVPE
jgi:hypothetical protein